MNKKKLLNYTIQRSMLKQLYDKGLITESEFQKIKKELEKDYGVVSGLTTNC
ncbi:MAG: SHOCT domain-containing protein [Eubacteriales bacterium]|nr:SHOCT domain-containing protein [Eubacteriales bacterium]